jgi:hypothetical protein
MTPARLFRDATLKGAAPMLNERQGEETNDRSEPHEYFVANNLTE